MNDLRKQRRLVSCGLEDVSSDEEEEDVPDLTALLAASMRPNSISSVRLPISQPDPVVSEATGSNALDIGMQDRTGEPLTEIFDWHAAIASANQPVDPNPSNNMAVVISGMGPVFKLSEASKNLHELEPSAIPFILKQMAQYLIFTPLSMFTTKSMDIIRNNVGDLYTKKKTGSAVGKYVLNSDLFPSKENLTKSMFFQAYRNWIKLLSKLAEPEVARGWQDHHE